LLDADGLAGEDLTEIDLLVIETDSAAGRDSGRLVVKRIVATVSFSRASHSSRDDGICT
jgi:hypothetical protein